MERAGIGGVVTGDGLQDGRRVPHRARHRPHVIERPVHGEHPTPAHEAVGRLVAHDAAHRGRPANGPARIGAERAGAEARGHRHPGARGGARGNARHVPRVTAGGEAPLARGTAEGPLVHRELAEHHRARRVKPLGDERVAHGHVIGEHFGAACHAYAGHRDEVLERQGHALERAAPAPARLFRVGGAGARQRRVPHHRDVGLEHAVVPGDALEVGLGRFDRGDPPRGEGLAHAPEIEIAEGARGHRHGSSSGAGTAARSASR
jgi:hypothetical protein